MPKENHIQLSVKMMVRRIFWPFLFVWPAILPLFSVLTVPAYSADQIFPKTYIETTAKHIRLGDIFPHLDYHTSQHIVAIAPPAGEQRKIAFNKLVNLARKYKLNWQPINLGNANLMEDIILYHPAHTIENADIIDSIRGHIFATDGSDADIKIELYENLTTQQNSKPLFLSQKYEPTIRLENFIHDSRSGEFRGMVIAPANGSTALKIPIKGKITRMIEIPVLIQALDRQAIIQDSDITYKAYPANILRQKIILSEDDLVGMVVTKPIQPGQPVKIRAVRPQILVQRNKLITIKFQRPGLYLTTQGKALEDGTLNETIRVENTQSKIIVQALVTDLGHVTVSPSGFQPVNMLQY